MFLTRARKLSSSINIENATAYKKYLINEALTYNYENKRKFDLIAAFGMAMLGDEELTLRGM